MSDIKSYKDLIIWKKSMELVRLIYELTNKFPQSEIYGLTSQMRRAAVAIPSNIAEGYGRRSSKEYLQFLSIAYGSSLELETQIILSNDLKLVREIEVRNILILLEEIKKMLYVLMFKIKQKSI